MSAYADMGPPEPEITPAPVLLPIGAKQRRFVVTSPEGEDFIEHLYSVPMDQTGRLVRSFARACAQLGLWVLTAVFIAFIPFVGVLGWIMLLGSPITLLTYWWGTYNLYAVFCRYCGRGVQVGGGWTHEHAHCACGARYRRAKPSEYSAAEVNSNF